MITIQQTYSNIYQSSHRQSRTSETTLIICASLFIALCAQIKIPLFFSPVPITGQTFAVVLIGALLGSRNGALAAAFYIIEGTCGLPFFTGGSSGLATLLGPTGGYFAGFIVQAYLIGRFMESQKEFDSRKLLAAICLCSLVQMSMGMAWLAHFVGIQNILIMGFIPFLPGGFLKSLAAVACIKAWKGIHA